MSPWFTPLVVLAACEGLDRVPILEGGQCAPERDATVACIRDGDTIELDYCGGEAVRLLGIDAPEIAHEGEPAECYGDEATQRMTWLASGQAVRLRFDTTCTDAYDRTLAYVYLVNDPEDEDDDVLLNEQLVREGYVRVYEDFDDIKLADLLYTAEAAARNAGLGLWGACEGSG